MNLTEGNIIKNLIRFSIPIILSACGSVALSISDNIIVASTLGQSALATISSVSGVTALGYILITGFSSAFTIIASKSIEEQSKVYRHSMLLSYLSGILLTLIFLIGSPLFTKMMNVPDSISSEACYCLRIYGISFFFCMIENSFVSLFNGFNNSKTPMYITIGSNILNILLDLLFLAVFKLPVVYAVYASLLSIIVATIILYIVFHHNYTIDKKIKYDYQYMLNILKLSLSMMFQQSIVNISAMFMSMKINTLGVGAITINTACENIQNLYILVFIGFTNAFCIFIGSNMAKSQYDRIKQGLHDSLKLGAVLFIIMGVFAFITFPYLLKLYISDMSSIQYSFSKLFRITMILSFIAFFIKYLLDGFMKAYEDMNYFLISSALNLTSRMIFLYLLVDKLNLYAIAISCILSIYLSMCYNIYIYFTKYKHKLDLQEG